MYTPKRIFILLFVLTLLASSCLKDIEYLNKDLSKRVELAPGLRAPVAFGTLTIEDLVNEFDSSGYVQPDDSGFLYIYYTDEFFSRDITDVIEIDDQQFLEVFIDADVGGSGFLPVPLGDTVTTAPKDEKFEFVFTENQQVDSVFVKAGTLNINVNSSFEHSGYVDIESPGIEFDGEPFFERMDISDPSGTFTDTRMIDLSGVKITLADPYSDTAKLAFTFTLSLINSGNPVDPSDECQITLDFENLEIQSAYGYVGQYELLDVEDSIFIDFYNLDFEGEIYFADPQINLRVENSFGIPVGIDIQTLRLYNDNNGQQLDLIFQPGTNPFEIDAPTVDSIGTTKITEISINKSNSNIIEGLNLRPTQIYYLLAGGSNPVYMDSSYNFVTDTSYLNVGLEAVLPLWLRAQDLKLTDTFELDLEGSIGDEIDYIQSIEFILDVGNGLPLEATVQLYFLDENDMIIDSLDREGSGLILNSATLGPDERVTEAFSDTLKARFIKEELKEIKRAKKAKVKAIVNTTGQGLQYVKFYSDYTIEFKLKINVDAIIEE